MIDDGSFIRLALQSRRASLPGTSKLSKSTERRKTFAAAMQQFEEQMTAANIVTTMTRPINLYYALVQAGAAITAAHADDPWSFNRHGLKVVDYQPGLQDIEVRTDGIGGFQAVARATGSPIIDGPVTLGALWASIPDFGPVGPLSSKAPQSLGTAIDESVIYTHPPFSFDFNMTTVHTAVTMPNICPRASVYVVGEMPEDKEGRQSWIADFVQNYPGADGATLRNDIDAFGKVDDRSFKVEVEWPQASQATAWTRETLRIFFDERCPDFQYSSNRFFRPSLESGREPPSLLMSWWLLLYSFSMLARYRPRKWLDLLNLDKSHDAVPIQFAMETAITTLPHLIVEALDQEPMLLQKPLRWG